MKKIVLFAAFIVAFAICLPVVKAATDAEIDQAIQDGLAWLAAKQNTTDGSWGHVYYKVGKTGLAVKKFEHYATEELKTSPLNPAYLYYSQVRGGLDYLFRNAEIVDISGDPGDTDGDGKGVAFVSDGFHYTYETGIALMAIVESNAPDKVVNVPGSPVNGWTYQDVAEDAMNWLAYAQIDAGTKKGGWGYTANSGGDQSNSGYATLGVAFSEASLPHGFGLSVPQFVKDRLGDPDWWIDYIQNDASGGGGYSSPTSNVCILETGNLLFEMAWYGDNVSDQRVKDAVDFIVDNWGVSGPPPGGPWGSPYSGWLGSYQAMYTMMKGLEAFGIDKIDGIDWFDEVSTHIVNNQHANGSWGPSYWDNHCSDYGYLQGDTVLSVSWALLTLERVTIEPPVPSYTQMGIILLMLAVAGFLGYMILRRRKAVISAR